MIRLLFIHIYIIAHFFNYVYFFVRSSICRASRAMPGIDHNYNISSNLNTFSIYCIIPIASYPHP